MVCIIGASAFRDSWLVKLLQQRDNPSMTEHLQALAGAKDRLHLFKANLLEEGSFDF